MATPITQIIHLNLAHMIWFNYLGQSTNTIQG
jgi:hypothetical protein